MIYFCLIHVILTVFVNHAQKFKWLAKNACEGKLLAFKSRCEEVNCIPSWNSEYNK